jgi:hypothetical protein
MSSDQASAPLLPTGAIAMRNIFVISAWCWTVVAVCTGITVGIYAMTYALNLPGWLSLAFGLSVLVQGVMSYFKLHLSIRRYIRFGLTSAAFSRTSPVLIIVWFVQTALSIALYVSALVEFVLSATSGDKSEDQVQVARMGVVWFSLLGGLMLSVLIGTVVVSRMSPWASSFFLRPHDSDS